MKRSRADVIIVGAGPAGSVTALLLARAGVDVLILDRAAFPRPKPCGDCLSAGASALLRRLGLLDTILAAPHARLSGWRIAAPDGSSFDAAFDAAGSATALTVERATLDALLLDAAIRAGARFDRRAVTDVERDAHGRVCGVNTRSGTIRAALTVGADGLRSVIALRLGARAAPGRLRKLSLTFHLTVDGTGDLGEMHTGDGICAGVAPVNATGRCNLTLVADAHRFGRDVADDAYAFARDALAALPLLRGRVATAALHDSTRLASGPFDRPCRRATFDGAVLVGDAAGYYDPFTGQGVYQAIASAELLSRDIGAALRTGDVSAGSFAAYARARTRLLRGPRIVQRGIELALCRPVIANRAIERVRRAPAFARAIISVTGDVAPTRTLLAPRGLTELLRPAIPPENAA